MMYGRAILGWDNQDDLNPMFAWEFKKNDLVRLGKGSYTPKVEFWKRYVFAITYTPEGLNQFTDHQICIDWLKNKVKTGKCILG